MTTVTNALGTNVAVLDTTQPFTALTSGEGSRGAVKTVEDVLAMSGAFVSASGNYGRLCRFPANVKIKSVEVTTDVAPDSSSTQSLAIDFGVVFSDSTIDGTPSAYQGLIPTTVGVGGGTVTSGTTTTFSSYSSPNKWFGTLTLSGNNAKVPLTNITFSGSLTTYPFLTTTEQPAVEIFNFWDGRSQPMENLGWFDIYAYVSHAAATTATSNLFVKVTYVD